jgi:hypothetical protein
MFCSCSAPWSSTRELHQFMLRLWAPLFLLHVTTCLQSIQK